MNDIIQSEDSTVQIIEQITDKMYMGESVKDDRPLTEEILKKLGFENDELMIWNVLLIVCHYKDKIWVQIYDNRYSIATTEQIKNMDYYPSNRWKTVDKLKMLISCLNGDE